MKKQVTIAIVVFLVLLAVAGAVYYRYKYLPKHEWHNDLRKGSSEPYGLKVFYNLLESQDEKLTVVYNHAYEELDTTLVNANYICVSHGYEPSGEDAGALLRFASKGNNVLISSSEPPSALLELIVMHDTLQAYHDLTAKEVMVNFAGDSPFTGPLDFHHKVLKDTVHYSWSGYTTWYFDHFLRTAGFQSLSTINGEIVNAFYAHYGKGRVIIHCNPVMFANYHMVRRQGFEQANNMLALLHKGPTYWEGNYVMRDVRSNEARSNPIRFLFTDARLTTAWYLLLVSVFLYLFFRSRREQRPIPVMAVNRNSSVEYTRAIGTLYYRSKGHKSIANEMYTLFLADVRSRYGLFADLDETKFTDLLSQRSGIALNLLYSLMKQFRHLRTEADAGTDDLIDLHNALEQYYKRRK